MAWKLVERQKKWLSEERGTVHKDWGGKIRVALAYPNRYAVGMSNLGFHAVYGLLNEREDVVCERIFYPEPEDMKLLADSPGELLSVESQKPLREFDIVAFSLSFENDSTNLVEMLALGGIPVRSEERSPSYPLVATGGVATFLNPEPLAPFVDFFFTGEAEVLLPDFLAFWRKTRWRDGNLSKLEFLTALGREIAGIYVPSLYTVSYNSDGTIESMEAAASGLPERVRYRRADIARSPICRTMIHTPNTEFSNVTLVELGRGCGRGCRFCAAGYVYRPPRHQPADRLVEAVREGRGDDEGPARLGLVSPAVSDHPEVGSLCTTLMGAGASLSFSSLRADAITPEILNALNESRHQAVAIAPEAGSDRLRKVINKHLDRDRIYGAAERLAEAGILHLKLYFMIGLPTESLDDLEAIVDLTKGIKHHVLKTSRGRKQLGTITLSVNSFIPKPFTPFQWSAFAGVRELKERARWIQKALQRISNVRVHFDLPKWAYTQAVLTRADRRADTILQKVALDKLSWNRVLKSTPINPDFWAMRERDQDERFPWEIIDHGIKRSYLWEEYQRALSGEQSPECMPHEHCKRCGVCTPA